MATHLPSAVPRVVRFRMLQVQFKIGAVPNDGVVETMQLFAREVLPHVRHW